MITARKIVYFRYIIYITFKIDAAKKKFSVNEYTIARKEVQYYRISNSVTVSATLHYIGN